MTRAQLIWVIALALMTGAFVWSTRKTAKSGFPGILIDNRERLSLSQFQMTLWTLVVLSLFIGVFADRFLAGIVEFMDVDIPGELLTAMGISLASGATAAAIKAGKDARGAKVRERNGSPHLDQLYYAEEGTPDSVDVTRFQNLWLTAIVLLSYVATAWMYLAAHPDPASLTALPGFGETLVALFGISHAGYIAGKMPDKL